MFSDTDFIRKLSTEDRSLFQKIWDEVKYLCKVVTAGSKEAKQLEQVKKAFEEAYRESGAQKNTAQEGGVKYSLAKVEDVTPSREQRDQNIRDVAQMESVYTVDESKLIPGAKSIKETYREFFTQWGENIHSDVFGDIAVKNSSIRSEMRHGSTPVKVASIEAIPSVIQNGKIVEWIQKDSGLFRIVVAAPIKIGETPYFMGVMLQRDAQNQRLYLHDVVIEEEASNLSQEHLDSTGPYEEHENLYTSSILDKIAEVKRNADIKRNSLSGSSEDIGPLPGQVYGKDILLEAPIREDVSVQVGGDIGPVAGNATPNASNAIPNANNATANASLPDDTPSRDDIEQRSDDDMDAEEPPEIRTVRERLTEKLYSSREELASNEKIDSMYTMWLR